MTAWLVFFALTTAGGVGYVWAWRNREDVYSLFGHSVRWVDRFRLIVIVIAVVLFLLLDALALLDSIFDIA